MRRTLPYTRQETFTNEFASTLGDLVIPNETIAGSPKNSIAPT